MTHSQISIAPVADKADFNAFIDLAYRLNDSDPNWVPPLRSEVVELLTPGRNPFHEHAEMQLFLARRDGRAVGRISAHFDRLALEMPPEQGMGPGTGNWGLLEAEDRETAQALIAAAEEWLRGRGMTRVLAPISLSVWEEPGLLVRGHDHPPAVMMGHHPPQFQEWIESTGYAAVKHLYTYELDVTQGFPPLIQRIIASGEKNSRINVRPVDKSRFAEEAATIMAIFNDAWSGNWGFVPLTDSEIAYAGKKLKPLIHNRLNMIAELDGEPVAFMMTLPNLNEPIAAIRGRLFPFGWARLLWWLWRPRVTTMRVPLMGVVQRLQSSRMASQLAFMMIERIRLNAVEHFGATRGEIGWILDDNRGMVAIADAIESSINKEYVIYHKSILAQDRPEPAQ